MIEPPHLGIERRKLLAIARDKHDKEMERIQQMDQRIDGLQEVNTSLLNRTNDLSPRESRVIVES